jgi:hypothetical protein
LDENKKLAQVKVPAPVQLPLTNYSYLKASTGSKFAARLAG